MDRDHDDDGVDRLPPEVEKKLESGFRRLLW
jgi:hypothetical protein